eukprot:6474223-Amphidinium_carterae.1
MRVYKLSLCCQSGKALVPYQISFARKRGLHSNSDSESTQALEPRGLWRFVRELAATRSGGNNKCASVIKLQPWSPVQRKFAVSALHLLQCRNSERQNCSGVHDMHVTAQGFQQAASCSKHHIPTLERASLENNVAKSYFSLSNFRESGYKMLANQGALWILSLPGFGPLKFKHRRETASQR